MTTDVLEKAKALEREIASLELDIAGYDYLVKKLEDDEDVVMHIEGITRFSYKVNQELADFMIRHYKEKISDRQTSLAILQKQFNEL